MNLDKKAPSQSKINSQAETQLNAVLVGKFIGRGAQFVAGFVLAQRLGVVMFGIFALAYTLFKLIGTAFVPLGLSRGVLRYGAERGNATYSTALVITVLAGFVAMIGLWIAADTVAALFRVVELAPVLRIFSVFVPAIALVDVCAASLRASHRVDRAVWFEDVLQPISALGLVLLLPQLTPMTAGIALGVSYVLAAVPLVTMVVVRWERPRRVRSLMQYSLVAMVFVVLMLGLQWVDRLLIGVLFTVREVGLYQAAAQVTMVFAVIIAAEVAVVAPQISTLYIAGNWAELERVYQQTTLWGFKLSMAVYVLVMGAPVLILLGLYGPAYVGAARVLMILCTAQLINALTGACATFMLVTAQQNRLALIYAAAMLLNGGMSWTLAHVIGVAGVAVGTATALIFATMTMTITIHRRTGVLPFSRDFIVPIGALCVVMLMVILAGQAGGWLWQVGFALWSSVAVGVMVLYPDLRRVLIAWKGRTQ